MIIIKGFFIIVKALFLNTITFLFLYFLEIVSGKEAIENVTSFKYFSLGLVIMVIALLLSERKKIKLSTV